jgi:hypothetical protein
MPHTYEGVSKSFRTGLLEWELQMVQVSATRCSCIAILWVSLMSFAAITLCVVSQRVFIVVSVYFVIISARKLLDIPSYDMDIYDTENICWMLSFIIIRSLSLLPSFRFIICVLKCKLCMALSDGEILINLNVPKLYFCPLLQMFFVVDKLNVCRRLMSFSYLD